MVDLAKLRKKARKKGEEVAPEAEGAPAETTGSAPDVDPAPAAPQAEPEAEPTAEPKPPEPVAAAPSNPAPAAAAAAPAPPAVPPSSPTSSSSTASESKLERFMAEAGRKRDEAIASAAAEVSGDADLLELLTFVIAGEHYAVDIETIVEIVRPRPLTRIPNADASIVGIMSLRGTIVTLVDARLRLGHKTAAEQTDDTRVVVIDRGNEILGFAVDHVLRVVKVAHSSVEPHPVVHASEQHDAIRGVFRTANALTILLDLDKLLDHTGQAADAGSTKARVAQR
jgi:purine-binding chemotaxis protein CheW